MEKKPMITENHITELYKFTREHFVVHYDVQTELVDHLANDIEQIWIAKPHLTFQEARTISFKKFGVFGFMNVVGLKQKQLNKKYHKILWNYAKEWFSFPKVVLTFSLYFTFYYVLQFKLGVYLGSTLFLFGAFFAGFKLYNYRKRLKRKEKKWMLEEMIFTQGGGSSFVIATYPLHFFSKIFSGSYETILMSTFLTAICIVLYVSLIVIPSKSEELLLETYPEYKLV